MGTHQPVEPFMCRLWVEVVTIAGGAVGLVAAAPYCLPAQADFLLQLLDLAVAVALLISLLLPAHVALHQLDGRDQGLRYAEVGVLLQKWETWSI